MSVTLAQLQERAWALKVQHGFDLTDVRKEFFYLREEIDEAQEAWEYDPDGLPGELADIALFLFGLARKTGVDLEAAILDKMQVIAARTYVQDPATGEYVKVEGR